MRKISCLCVIFLLTSLLINSAFASTQAVNYLCELGVNFYNQGRYEDALFAFKKVLFVDPQNQTAKTYVNNIFQPQQTAAAPVNPEKAAPVVEPKASQAPPAKEASREEAINKAFYIAAAFDLNYFHYSEWEDNNKMDEDFGNLYGSYFALGYRSPNYYELTLGKPFIEGYYEQYSNMINYKGRVTVTYPDETKEVFDSNAPQRSKIAQFGVKMGVYNDFTAKGEFCAYMDIGKRIWNRGEDESPDYHERYYWAYGGLGFGINHRFFPKLSTGIDAEYLFALDPRMHANDNDVTYKLGRVYGFGLRIPIKYYLLKNLSLDVTPYFAYWRIGRSDDVPIDDTDEATYEPASKTHLEGLRAGLTYSF